MNKILLVEDHPWYAAQQRRVLEGAGYEVVHATDPQAAMDILDEHKPVAIVLDMLLRANTAMVLLHELQSHNETADVPIVVYTAQAATQENVLYPYGVVALLDKTTMEPGDTVKALKRVGL